MNPTSVAVVLEAAFAVPAFGVRTLVQWRRTGSTGVVPPRRGAIGALAALVVGLELQVRFVEEPYLRRGHGPGYERYAARAGRFLPRTGTRKVPG